MGGAALFAAWGEPARPGFPLWGNGKGDSRTSLLPQALFPAPNADSPCFHPHSLLSFRSGAIWGPQSQRVLPSQNRTIGLISEASVPPRPRSHPNPAIGLTQLKTESLRPLSPLPRFSSAARILRLSPTDGAAGSPVFLPPPQSLFSLRSCHRVPPALSPTVSDPCPAPGSP